MWRKTTKHFNFQAKSFNTFWQNSDLFIHTDNEYSVYIVQFNLQSTIYNGLFSMAFCLDCSSNTTIRFFSRYLFNHMYWIGAAHFFTFGALEMYNVLCSQERFSVNTHMLFLNNYSFNLPSTSFSCEKNIRLGNIRGYSFCHIQFRLFFEARNQLNFRFWCMHFFLCYFQCVCFLLYLFQRYWILNMR